MKLDIDFKRLHLGKLTLAAVAGFILPILSAYVDHRPIDLDVFLQALAGSGLTSTAMATNARKADPT